MANGDNLGYLNAIEALFPLLALSAAWQFREESGERAEVGCGVSASDAIIVYTIWCFLSFDFLLILMLIRLELIQLPDTDGTKTFLRLFVGSGTLSERQYLFGLLFLMIQVRTEISNGSRDSYSYDR